MKKASLKELKNDARGRRVMVTVAMTEVMVQMVKGDLSFLWKAQNGNMYWYIDDRYDDLILHCNYGMDRHTQTGRIEN